LIDSLVFGNNKQHRLVQTLILVERRGDRIKTKETGFLAVAIGFNASSGKKTRFLTTRASNQRNRVFGRGDRF
jgi:hypothetical protein